MQEAVHKRKEKSEPFKHKRTKKPIFKPKGKAAESKTKTQGTPKISAIAEQKGKSRFIAPKTGNPQKIEIKTAALPVFRSKKSTIKSVRTEQEINAISTEIRVKKEAKERLKGSIEELLSDPQQLTNLSGIVKEFEGKIVVKTDFDSSISTIKPPTPKVIEKLKVPEIKSEKFAPSVSKAVFDTSLPKITIEERVVTAPEITVTKQPEVMIRTNFDEEVSSQVVSKIKEKMVEVEKEVEEKLESEKTAGGEPETIENIIDALFISLKGGSCLKWKLTRPLCILLTGDKRDGMRTIEDLISTKYTFHGFYDFSKNLPWQEIVKDAEVERKLHKLPTFEPKKGIYDKIISEELIVSDVVGTNDKDEIIKGLRDISNRGAKCVILYTKNLNDFENLDLEVANADVKIIGLPELDDKAKKLISKLVGIDLETLGASVDSSWRRAVRLYEEEAEELDRKLPSKDVDYFPERETGTHYLRTKPLRGNLECFSSHTGSSNRPISYQIHRFQMIEADLS